jgi:hypothetical protein
VFHPEERVLATFMGALGLWEGDIGEYNILY